MVSILMVLHVLYYRHINFDVPKVLKLSPHFQRWTWTNSLSFFNPRQNTALYNALAVHCNLLVKIILIYFAYVNHTQICTWNQPVLYNEGSCSRKQRVRHSTNCATPPTVIYSQAHSPNLQKCYWIWLFLLFS